MFDGNGDFQPIFIRTDVTGAVELKGLAACGYQVCFLLFTHMLHGTGIFTYMDG